MANTFNSKAVLEKVAASYVTLFGTQLLSRGLSFISNLAIARMAQRDAYGVASALQICCCDVGLMLSREGFRDACQRTSADRWQDPARRSQILRVAWFSLPISVLIGVFVMFFPYALGLDQSKYSSMANYHEALTIYVISSILEVMSNPLYILAQNLLLLRLRSLIDMFSLLLRVAVTYVCLIIAPNAPLRAFALGQLANSCVPLVAYVTYFSAARGGLGVRGTALVLLGLGGAMDGAGMDWGLVRMAFTMCGKTVQKLILEKGETLVRSASACRGAATRAKPVLVP